MFDTPRRTHMIVGMSFLLISQPSSVDVPVWEPRVFFFAVLVRLTVFRSDSAPISQRSLASSGGAANPCEDERPHLVL